MRAEQLWNARVAEDWARAFEFEEPQQRAGYNLDEFVAWHKQNEPLIIHEYRLGRVETDGTLGWVEITQQSSVRRFQGDPPRETHRWEKWYLIDGEWYPIEGREQVKYPEAPSLRDLAAEAELRRRFEENWRARQAEDWPAMHAMLTPADREAIPLDQVMQEGSGLHFLNREVEWVQVIGDRGVIRVRYEVKPKDPNLSKMPAEWTPVTESWVRVDGQWYRALARPTN